MMKRAVVFLCFLLLAVGGVVHGKPFEPALDAASTRLTLREAARRALAGHPRIEAARARLEASRALVKQAQAAFWPVIMASAEYDEKSMPLSALGMGNLIGGPFAPSSVRSVVYREGLGFQVPIYRGERDRQALSVARIGSRASGFEMAGVQENLVAMAIEAYISHERAGELLKSAQEHETSINAQLKRVGRNIEAGIGVKFDRLQVEVRLEAAREAVLVGGNAVDAARTALNLAMGASPSTPLSTLPVASFPEILESLPDLQMQMLASNSALEQLRQQVEASHHVVAMEKAGKKPNATLSGSLSKFGTDLPVKERGWTITGSFEWKLFDGGFTRAKIDEARHRHDASRAILEDLKQQLLAALERAWLDNHSAQQRLDVGRKGLELAEEQVRLSGIQQEAGYITLTDLLDKQAELTRARVTLIGARYDTYLAALSILKLTGRLTPDFAASLTQ